MVNIKTFRDALQRYTEFGPISGISNPLDGVRLHEWNVQLATTRRDDIRSSEKGQCTAYCKLRKP
jgi:hypothetical protein